MSSELEITAPFAGTVIAVAREPGEPVQAGVAVIVLEAMKMEHELVAEADGIVRRVAVAVGDAVDERQLLAVIRVGEQIDSTGTHEDRDVREDQRNAGAQRSDLAAVDERHPRGL